MLTWLATAWSAFTILRRSFVYWAMATRDNRFRHTFSTERFLVRLQSNLFSFHQEEAAARRSRLPQTGPAKRPKDGAQGLHKTSIYNIIRMDGQTADHACRPCNPMREREAHPRITWNIGATLFSQPMVTCQNRLKTIGPIQMGVHEYQANVRSGAKRRRKERPASQGESNQSRGI